MKRWVVDASVVAAAFFQEHDAEPARTLLRSGAELLAPDLVYAEFGNVIWKRRRCGEINDQEAAGLLADCLRLPLQITVSRELAAPALELAVRTGRTVYDCLYLALAIRSKAVLVTGDRRLVNALALSPLGSCVVTVGEHR